MRVWVLTKQVNEYDQEPEHYFMGIFKEKPTIEIMAKFFSEKEIPLANNIAGSIALIEHIRNGGGRQEYENTWYYLSPYDCIE